MELWREYERDLELVDHFASNVVDQQGTFGLFAFQQALVVAGRLLGDDIQQRKRLNDGDRRQEADGRCVSSQRHGPRNGDASGRAIDEMLACEVEASNDTSTNREVALGERSAGKHHSKRSTIGRQHERERYRLERYSLRADTRAIIRMLTATWNEGEHVRVCA